MFRYLVVLLCFENLFQSLRADGHMCNSGLDDMDRRRRLMTSSLDAEICPNAPDWECGDRLTFCQKTFDNRGFGCICDVDIEGDPFCWNDDFCFNGSPCTTSDDCPGDRRCASTCCSQGNCLDPCEDPLVPTLPPTPVPTAAPTWVAPCANDPCDCGSTFNTSSNATNEDPLCEICHIDVGCSQCYDVGTNFKLDYNFPCVNCQSVFGNECTLCQDFQGCAACVDGFVRTLDEMEDLYYCQSCVDAFGEGCLTCEPGGCQECMEYYELQTMEGGDTTICVSV